VELQEPEESGVEVVEVDVAEVLQEQVGLEGLVKRVMRSYLPAVGNVRQPVELQEPEEPGVEVVEVLQEQTVVA
jgi:hypothetical protein